MSALEISEDAIEKLIKHVLSYSASTVRGLLLSSKNEKKITKVFPLCHGEELSTSIFLLGLLYAEEVAEDERSEILGMYEAPCFGKDLSALTVSGAHILSTINQNRGAPYSIVVDSSQFHTEDVDKIFRVKKADEANTTLSLNQSGKFSVKNYVEEAPENFVDFETFTSAGGAENLTL
eukprot:GHVP01058668.1.p1 GENE.GHVP01058668.1~~GHVP01058668.1.p1  ORF type:complete len:178 (+),score=26.56 GHVP01058668.1:21-554(+)